MDKKQGLKRKASTKKGKGQRIYATPQSTLINHPTRLKILEALSLEKTQTTRELESFTNENRVNLYYHLNLLEVEGVLMVSTINREKHFQLKKQQLQPELLSIKLQVPKDNNKRSFFMQKLNDLFSNADKTIPNIDIDKLADNSVDWIVIQFESE